MVDPLTFALTNLHIIDEVKKFAIGASDSSESDVGKAYRRIMEWKKDRARLTLGGVYSEAKKEGNTSLPCESSALQAVRNLYSDPIRPGVVNVLYDTPGTGKSMAGIGVFEEYYLLQGGNKIKGIMVSTESAAGLYVKLLQEILKVSKVEGWLYLLLFVLSEPKGSMPSLLILDDFNLDENGENLNFISHLYKRMNPPNRRALNIMVVVITQDINAANTLCAMNGGQRVRPLEGFYETQENAWNKFLTATNFRGTNDLLTNPVWKSSTWTKELLIQMLEYHFTKEEMESIGEPDFITEKMTPYEAKIADSAKLLKGMAGMPVSPVWVEKGTECIQLVESTFHLGNRYVRGSCLLARSAARRSARLR